MQALCCLLRSRQRGRSISAALQRATALSATSCNAFEAAHVSSKITSGSSSHGFHAADSSFTRLSKQLEGFALLKAQMFGPVYPGGACVGNSVLLKQWYTSMPKGTAMPQGQQSLGDTGWTRQDVYNVPNAISMARLASGPVIAWLVLTEQWGVALVSLAVSGASDWADGYVAKRYDQSSVLGSYLDPLADKVLIGCLVGALGYQGSLPVPLVALIIGRDVVLLSGAFVHRFREVGWRWPGLAEFFRLSSSSPSVPPAGTQSATPKQSASSTGSAHQGSNSAEDAQDASHVSKDTSTTTLNPAGVLQNGSQTDQAAVGNGAIPPAVFVQPLYISKVNTCFQLLLVGGCLSSSWYAWPPQEAIFVLGVATGGLTLASCAAYVRIFFKGSVK